MRMYCLGFETSSSTSNLCLFELSRHPVIQKRVQDEIDLVKQNSNSSEITYDMLQQMKYLDMCINETLRKYPVITVILRKCTKDHTFTGTKYTVKKGTTLFIPVEGLHRDSTIYENPMAFIPERFKDSPTGLGDSKGTFYLPFGDGPR
jgi:cytochrome P450 family 6